MQNSFSISVSIVSHGHGEMVNRLVQSLLENSNVSQIILTKNIPERTEFIKNERIILIENQNPKGFGANHNAAFKRCSCDFFCILNPDVGLTEDVFLPLLNLSGIYPHSILAPLVVSSYGKQEDSVRHFPTFLSLCKKALWGADGRYDLAHLTEPQVVDWVAGMFVLIKANDFRMLGGFDERYFMYYEDVDLCARATSSGMNVVVLPTVSIVHNGQRDSHRKMRYMLWHLKSMMRFLLTKY